MHEVRYEQVVSCLHTLDIQNGDGLLVHSAVHYLGRPQGGLQMYLDAILSIIGEKGTIAVPAFNFGFAQGESYDPAETPSKGMGAFSEFIRLQPGTLRTPHPMQSLAVIGRFAQDLAARDTASAFDPGSAFERMLQLDFKLLLLGADERAISIFHYAEQRAVVPYRYWKEFRGEYRTPSGWQERTYRMYVRDMDLNPDLTLRPIVLKMLAEGHWHSIPLNYGMITTCRLQDFILAAEEILSVDPWQLVINRNPPVQTTANNMN
jgi:aminoglycoside 3-N-acetyltransferase